MNLTREYFNIDEVWLSLFHFLDLNVWHIVSMHGITIFTNEYVDSILCISVHFLDNDFFEDVISGIFSTNNFLNF